MPRQGFDMATIKTGTAGSDTLTGTNGADFIYGFNPADVQSNSIAATRVASGLSQPVFVAAPPGDTHRLFIVERTGLIKILDLDTGLVSATPFLDLTAQITTVGEGGLLGLAFDPDFATNGQFYVDLTNTSDDTEVRRYSVLSTDANRADPASAQLVIRIDQPDGVTNHKAGWIGFGPDKDLYVALGDGGVSANAQNIDSLLGKMLRLDVHGDDFPSDPNRNYAIPPDNMFVGIAGADEIFALGLRNPFRDSFDRATGTLFRFFEHGDAVIEFGQNGGAKIEVARNLVVEPCDHRAIRLQPHGFRNDVSVEHNHSKLGGIGMSRRATSSSTGRRGPKCSSSAVPTGRPWRLSARPRLSNALASSERL
jgi:glucose/arabinose dehydrogenase